MSAYIIPSLAAVPASEHTENEYIWDAMRSWTTLLDGPAEGEGEAELEAAPGVALQNESFPATVSEYLGHAPGSSDTSTVPLVFQTFTFHMAIPTFQVEQPSPTASTSVGIERTRATNDGRRCRRMDIVPYPSPATTATSSRVATPTIQPLETPKAPEIAPVPAPDQLTDAERDYILLSLFAPMRTVERLCTYGTPPCNKSIPEAKYNEHLHHKHGVSRSKENQKYEACKQHGCKGRKGKTCLLRHIEATHTGVRYKCRLCTCDFSYATSLTRHFKLEHKEWQDYAGIVEGDEYIKSR